MTALAGYTNDQPLPTSPVGDSDLDLLLATLLWTDAEERLVLAIEPFRATPGKAAQPTNTPSAQN